ncbi:MAG: LTA synthase family protein [Holophagaceae bacterium]|nr:LTA synthase family protein [Holophagaceae bacterium]
MALSSRSKTEFLALAGFGLLALLTLGRLAFLAHFQGLAWEPGLGRALYLGFKFDARWVAILLVPPWLLLRTEGGTAGSAATLRRWAALSALILSLLVYGGLVAVAMVDDRRGRVWLVAFLLSAWLARWASRPLGLAKAETRIWGAYGSLMIGFTLLCYAFDFGAFSYIHTRLNGTLLMFLENFGTSARMVWESYPVIPGMLGMLALLGLVAWLLKKLASGLKPPVPAKGRRWGVAWLGALLLVSAMWGKWSLYPLRWGEAFEAPKPFHAHLALNPVLFFLETREEMDGGYDLKAVQESQALMSAHFHTVPANDRDGLPTLLRRIVPRPQVQGRPNVVFIQCESLAAFKTSPFGNPLDPTPTLARLSREGIFFDRFYVVMENTSRSMFATLFGTPDVSSVQNATRNPLLVDQHTLLSYLTDYRKHYFLGGSANWAQIRAALHHNLPDLALHEEGSFKSPKVDVWGICDQDLLLEANETLAREQQPFFAYVQTSGNHPPFTIPPHIANFHRASPGAAELKAAGFVSGDEFNALRLMDHALDEFFKAASREPYFKDTIFVLWGDHGIPRGSNDARFGDLTLAIHNVPFILYAPGLLKPERRHTIASQVDILPTLLSLLGRETETQTLGRDLFDPAFDPGSCAFTFTTFRRPPGMGLLQDDLYLNLEPDGRAGLYSVDEPEPKNQAGSDPNRTAEMTKLARAYDTWSRYLLSHNKPLGPQDSKGPKP